MAEREAAGLSCEWRAAIGEMGLMGREADMAELARGEAVLRSEEPGRREAYAEEARHRERALEFWMRMAALFGARWLQAQGELPSPEWVAALARLSDAALAHGSVKLRRLKANSRGEIWPPTLIEFLALCRREREDLGLPADEAVFALMVHAAACHQRGEPLRLRRPLHAQLFRRLVAAGFLEQPAHQHQWSLFARLWALLLEEVAEGAALAEALPPLPPPGTRPRPARPETVREHLRRMREVLGMPPAA